MRIGRSTGNRRLAWARFYQARADTEQVTWWAAELAEWLDQLDADLPEQAKGLTDVIPRPFVEDSSWSRARLHVVTDAAGQEAALDVGERSVW